MPTPIPHLTNFLPPRLPLARTAGLRSLLLLVCFLLLPASVRAQWENIIGPGGNVTITRYTGPGGPVVIPSSIEQPVTVFLPVTGIASRAFAGCASVTSVAIPRSVATIEVLVFPGCVNLTGVPMRHGPSRGGHASENRDPGDGPDDGPAAASAGT
ncbi:MAG: hypothetical protein NTW21_40810 [Verrucomicrobia bacterium]|nr:hypothetical protein [Verrucomicrobiota bacterium]